MREKGRRCSAGLYKKRKQLCIPWNRKLGGRSEKLCRILIWRKRRGKELLIHYQILVMISILLPMENSLKEKSGCAQGASDR